MYLYMLNCADGSLYTGITPDIKKRIYAHFHKLPTGAKYTKSHPVTGVAALWKCEEAYARKLEYAVKQLKRAEKLALVQNPESISELFPLFPAEPVFDIKFEDCI